MKRWVRFMLGDVVIWVKNELPPPSYTAEEFKVAVGMLRVLKEVKDEISN